MMDAVGIRKKAMDFLARREYSRAELWDRLNRRFVDQVEEIERQLARLAEEGLQSDQRFTEAFIRHRCAGGFGPLRIRAELRQRGVEEAMISESLSAADIDWGDQLQALCDKKYGAGAPVDSRDRQRRQRFLAQKGYSAEMILALFAD